MKIRGIFFVLISTIGFAIMPIFAKYAYKSGISVSTLLLIRFTIASLLLFTYTFLKFGKIKINAREILSLMLLGGVLYTLEATLYFTAVKYISASLAVLILYTYPMIVAVISSIVDKERLPGRVILSILVAFAGLVIVVGRPESANFFGIAAAFASAVVYSFYIVLANRAAKNLPSLVTTSFVTLFASFGLLILGILRRDLSLDFTLAAWGPIMGLVIFSTILAIFTLFQGMELLGATRVSILSMMEPVFGVAFSVVLLNEALKIQHVVGGVIVITGAVMVILSKGGRNIRDAG